MFRRVLSRDRDDGIYMSSAYFGVHADKFGADVALCFAGRGRRRAQKDEESRV